MLTLTTAETVKIERYFRLAAEVAQQATCLRAKCGTVIVRGGEVIGIGYNSPPLDQEVNRHCEAKSDVGRKPKYDKTCCIHAEWRAILDACKRNADKIAGSRLYFMRIDKDGYFTDAGEPYCTVCSRLAMEAGVAEFALWNANKIWIYPTSEYDQLSYQFYAK